MFSHSDHCAIKIWKKIQEKKILKKKKFEKNFFFWKKPKKRKSRAFLEFRPYSAFNFGGRNRKPKGENFPFWPKDRNSGRPLPARQQAEFFLQQICYFRGCFLLFHNKHKYETGVSLVFEHPNYTIIRVMKLSKYLSGI